MNMLSRNAPIALVVGSAGFLGSHLTEHLLQKQIQVVGVDDLSHGKKENLEEVIKNKRFFFFNQPIQQTNIEFPRLDYAIFCINSDQPTTVYIEALRSFLTLVKPLNPKIAFISSIDLYDKDKKNSENLHEAEKIIAKFSKSYKANARILRLASLYGPRMNFKSHDPFIELLKKHFTAPDPQQVVAMDFTTRALFITDAVHLIVKSIFLNGTSHQIYDGSLIHPIKLSEVKQVLLDPLWFETRGFTPTPLPPWPTPNGERTQKELHWRPLTGLVNALKQTVHYFKEFPLDKEESREENSKDNFVDDGLHDRPVFASERVVELEKTEGEKKVTPVRKSRLKGGIVRLMAHRWFLVGVIILVYGLFYPLFSLALGGFTIRYHLQQASQSLSNGDFAKASDQIRLAEDGVGQIQEVTRSLAILSQVPVVNTYYAQTDQLVDTVHRAVQASQHAALGTQALYQSLKVISGAESGNQQALFDTAFVELSAADRDFAEVQAVLDDEHFLRDVPHFMRYRAVDLRDRVRVYQELVAKGKAVAYMLPQAVAIDGKKSYLVLFQNNMELRPGGGFIGSYAQVDFDHGKLTNIKFDDIYNLDGNLTDHVEPPVEIREDLNQKKWYLRDSNTDADFATDARTAQWFYRKEAGVQVAGVIGMDLSAAQKLLSATGPIELADYSESITDQNLFERAIAHAEVNFFPGSQAKRNFLTSLGTELFNNIFFLPKQDWPAIIQAMGQSLDEKHLLVYLSDQTQFAFLNSQSWSGIVPRQSKDPVGERNGFLLVSESNMGANKSNYYLQRSTKLDSSIGKNGEVNHTLTIHYLNQSPSEVWPAGIYKNRMKVYLPGGTKLLSASWGGTDITKEVSSYRDYGRAIYSLLINLKPKEEKDLVLAYQDGTPLELVNDEINYTMTVLKQPGIVADKFDFSMTYGLNFAVKDDQNSSLNKQEVSFSTDMVRDRKFNISLRKK